jgi:hypothetical protein
MTDIHDDQTSNQSTIPAEGENPPTAREEASISEPDDIAPPLAAMIASIRTAIAQNASLQARSAGASACRSILTVLEAKPGQPLATASPSPLPTQPQSPLASLLSQPGLLNQLAAMSREQLLDLLKQVTGAASPRMQLPASGGPRFHLIQLPQVRRPDGK